MKIGEIITIKNDEFKIINTFNTFKEANLVCKEVSVRLNATISLKQLENKWYVLEKIINDRLIPEKKATIKNKSDRRNKPKFSFERRLEGYTSEDSGMIEHSND